MGQWGGAGLDPGNDKRPAGGRQLNKEDQFELHRLEKENYFHVQTNGKDGGYGSPPIDDHAICCVCTMQKRMKKRTKRMS